MTQLQADSVSLQLPTDHLKTPATGFRPGMLRFEFVPSTDTATLRLLRAGGIGVDTLTTCLFGIQLSRYSGQMEVPLLVSTLGGSDQAQPSRLVHVSAERSRSRAALLESIEDGLARNELTAPPASGETPAAVLLMKAGFPESDADAALLLSGLSTRHATVDLFLVVDLSPDHARGAFLYNANLFAGETVTRFVGHLQVLLAQVIREPQETVGALTLLSRDEEAAIIAAGEGPKVQFPETPVHRLFEQRAAETPGAVAVRYRDQQLTYEALNRRANRLAAYLGSIGIGREGRVVVCVEPGLDIAIALLASLKAGAVYIPLEPTYPASRVSAILEDTQPQIVISTSALIERLGISVAPTFRLDVDAGLLAGLPDMNPDVPVAPEQTSYIYFTSGTTGKPKGVMGSHASLINYIRCGQVRYDICALDIMPAIARFSFSISMFELLSPLIAGGTLLVLDRDHIVDPGRMSETLQEVTFFHAGPSLLRGILAYIRQRHPDFRVFGKVRHASSGGDMIAPELLESLKEIFFRAEVFVIYGSSENNMGCTYPVSRDRTITRTYVGSTYANVSVRVLNEQRELVPFGVAGEICFGGKGVVKGYLNRPDLTAEKFIVIDGQRFYCMGDMGRLNAAGELEILGRQDFQIKLRGMRIELGEIEYALRRAPGVHEGVAMAQADGSGEKALVAYVVFQPQHGSGMAAVRQHMITQLPDYMVPAYYVELEKLPLNHNMKVDRRALPPLSEADRRGGAVRAVRAPESATEKALAALWSELLKVGEVGLDDNFFELGGHSVLAVELILGIERRTGVVLEGMEVLRESLEVLASLVDERAGNTTSAHTRQKGPQAAQEQFEVSFFGHDQGLYGVFHGFQASEVGSALLICGPLGQESVRSHFLLHKLSRHLAARSVAVLRFDYFGSGNSLGDDLDATCARWREDILDAFKEVKRRAPQARISVLGIRLGALLAWNSEVLASCDQLILVDPIVDGADYVRELQAMQEATVSELQGIRRGRRPRPVEGGQELLGFTFSEPALRELVRLNVSPTAVPGGLPVAWIASQPDVLQRESFARMQGGQGSLRFASLPMDCKWTDVDAVSDVLPDTGFTAAVVSALQGRGN